MTQNFNPAPPIIKYHVGDDNWSVFPDKLTNKAHNPHTVQILFNTNTHVNDRNLVLGVSSDAPDQKLDIFFDDHHIGEEIIQIGPFRLVAFWLGKIEKGPHKITIINQASPIPHTASGTLFDFLQVVVPITIPDDYPMGFKMLFPGTLFM